MTYPKRVLIAIDQHHCAQAYIAEMAGTQNAKEYRRG